MNGCVFKRKLPSGKITWGYSIDAGKDENGKRKQIFKSGFKLKGDADRELAKLLAERGETGEILRPDPRTFAEFAEAWLSEYAEGYLLAEDRGTLSGNDGARHTGDRPTATFKSHHVATSEAL